MPPRYARGAELRQQIDVFLAGAPSTEARGVGPANPRGFLESLLVSDATDDNEEGFVGRVAGIGGRGLTRAAGGVARLGATVADSVGIDSIADYLTRRAQSLEGSTALPVEGSTAWADVRENPGVGNVLTFAAEQGLGSIPDMVMVMGNPLLYGASRVGDIGQQRAGNDGRENASLGDLVEALPAAAASVALERFGTRGIIGPGTGIGGMARAGVREGLTEAGQGAIEYGGATIGTERGFSPREAFDEALAGLVAGTPFGAAAQGTVQMFNQLRPAPRALPDAPPPDDIVFEALDADLPPTRPAAPEPVPTGAAAVAQALREGGLPEPVVAGFLGNFEVEGGYEGALGDGGTASGIAQWRHDRRENFRQQFGTDPHLASHDDQARFVLWELQNPQAAGMTVAQRDRILRARTPEEAAALIDQFYERSSGEHRDRRVAAAARFATGIPSDATPSAELRPAAEGAPAPADPFATRSSVPADTMQPMQRRGEMPLEAPETPAERVSAPEPPQHPPTPDRASAPAALPAVPSLTLDQQIDMTRGEPPPTFERDRPEPLPAREPARPRRFTRNLTEMLERESEERGMPVRLSAQDAMSNGVSADAIFVDPRARYPAVKAHLQSLFASERAPLRSRGRNVEIVSLDSFGDRIDPGQWGMGPRTQRLEPGELGDLLRRDLDGDDSALDRNDPRYDAWQAYQQRLADYEEFEARYGGAPDQVTDAEMDAIDAERGDRFDVDYEDLVRMESAPDIDPWGPTPREEDYGAGPERLNADDAQGPTGREDQAGGAPALGELDPVQPQRDPDQPSGGGASDPTGGLGGQAPDPGAVPADRGTELELRGPAPAQQQPSAPAQRLSGALQRVASSHQSVSYRRLAQRLSRLVGDAPVQVGGMEAGLRGSATLDPDGTARARVQRESDAEAVLHESVHVATLRRYGELKDGLETGTAADGPLRELEQLRIRANKAFRDRDGEQVRYALSSTDEFLAHGLTSPEFQGWLRRHETAGLWGRFVDWVRRVLGLGQRESYLLDRTLQAGNRLMSEMERTAPAAQTGTTLLQKEFQSRDAWKQVNSWADSADAIRGDIEAIRETIGDPKGAFEALLGPIKKFGSALFFTNDGRLRSLAARFNSPAIEEEADLYYAPPGEDRAVERTYHEAVSRAATTRTQRAYEVLEPFLGDQAALDRVREMLTHPKTEVGARAEERAAARQLRDLLKETIDYRKDAGEEIGEVDAYFPRVLDVQKVMKDQSGFLAAAEQLYERHGADDPKARARSWFERIFDEYAGLESAPEFASNASVGARSARSREFGEEADRVLRGFYHDDVFGTLATYFTGAAKRAEYARRWGKPGREHSSERQAWIVRHGDISRREEWKQRVREDLKNSEADVDGVVRLLDNIHESNIGRVGQLGRDMRNVVSFLHAWNQVGKLDRVTITSLTELAMGFTRAGPRYGFTHFRDSLGEFARSLVRAEPSDAKRWAEAIGVANDAVVSQVLLSRIDADQTTTRAQRVLAGFYKATLLHQFTEGTRISAVKMGRRFLADLAADIVSPDARTRNRAALYLRELGVKEPEAFGQRLREGEPDRLDVLSDRDQFARDYGTALLRFTNQTVMMPSRAERPTWANHPVGSLFFSLQSYSYGLWKNVITRSGKLAFRGVKERDLRLLLPAMGLVILAGMTYLNDTHLRPFLFGSNYNFDNESPMTALLRTVDRAGFTGAASPVVNAFKGMRYQRPLAESLVGPVFGSIADTANKVAKPFVADSSENTETSERAAAAAIYDALIEPAADAFIATRLPPGVSTAGVLGDDRLKEPFVREVAGPKLVQRRRPSDD